jgi:lactate dehydrogenase-like 2-hydroxyacid dehydrogenase
MTSRGFADGAQSDITVGMSTLPCLLISHPMLSGLEPSLSKFYRPVRRWEFADDAAVAAAVGHELRAILHVGEIVLTREFLSLLPNLGLIACVSAGYDGVDDAWCRMNGVAVTHSQGDNAEDVADVALGLLLSVWRGLSAGQDRLRAGQWDRAKGNVPTPSLLGRRAGIVGLGHIGRAIAERLGGFGVEVSWWGPNPKDTSWPRAETLLQLAQDSDILFVATKADASNKGLISREIIEAVGPKGCIINVARGSVIDEDALISALKEERLGMAGLDVFETEPTPPKRWIDVPNVVLTPHLAGGTRESIPAMVGQARENLRRFFADEELLSPVKA